MTILETYKNGGLSALAGKTFECSCGRRHVADTKALVVQEDAIAQLPAVIAALQLQGNPLVVCDQLIWKIAGEAVFNTLQQAGLQPGKHVFANASMHADEHAVGSLLFSLQPNNYLVAVGSGNVCDTVRYVAFATGREFILVGTAPSMDGYSSSVAPVLKNGIKTTLECKPPIAVLGDVNILCDAPAYMVAAGLGDMIGKKTALLDWELARDIEGEYYCEELAELSNYAAQRCIDAASGLASREKQAIAHLMEGLILSGIAIQLMGNSRPASGAEHHVSHYLEMTDALTHREGRLHGDKVGVGTLMVMRFYQRFFSAEMPQEMSLETFEQWEAGMRASYGALAQDIMDTSKHLHPPLANWPQQKQLLTAHWAQYVQKAQALVQNHDLYAQSLHNAGGPISMPEMEYTKQEMLSVLIYSKEVRERFTIMRLIERFGLLTTYAEDLANEIYN